jgi:hypothetical protein
LLRAVKLLQVCLLRIEYRVLGLNRDYRALRQDLIQLVVIPLRLDGLWEHRGPRTTGVKGALDGLLKQVWLLRLREHLLLLLRDLRDAHQALHRVVHA